MSHRVIRRDPIQARRDEYAKLESEQMEAIMEVFALMSDKGMDLGHKMESILNERNNIKTKNTKIVE
jgi:hypothetical protein